MRYRAPPSLWSSSRGSFKATRCAQPSIAPSRRAIGQRFIQLNAVPSSSNPVLENNVRSSTPGSHPPAPDARFEVLGSPHSLLSVELSASQNLYTRRGTLVAVNGKAENAVSTLSLLEPFRRAPLGIPFLYQKISSTSPITALISSKSPITSFTVVHLDGRLDWIVAQRNALLAWTGHALSVKPKVNTKLSLAHWGQSHVTGRGLLALVGKGQVYQVNLKSGEEYIVHPGNVVAYTANQNPPLPYRFKSSLLRFQIPTATLGRLIPDVKFFQDVAQTNAWKFLAQTFFNLRTWTRRSIWGDRLFLRFHGPSTILLQSRGSRITDVLTSRDVNEITDTPAGAVQSAIKLDLQKAAGPKTEPSTPSTPSAQPASTSTTRTTTAFSTSEEKGALKIASVGNDGKVHIKDP